MSNKSLHKIWKNKFNTDCLKRDGNKCKFCNISNNLDVHHITDRHEMPNYGYVISNGITLCSEHHLLAEQFHMSNGKTFSENMHPNDLYKMINSSYEKAFNDSKNLK